MWIPSRMNKFAFSQAEQSVREHLKTHFEGVPSLICGVSGGVDSMVLMHLLHRAGAMLTVVHVNYQTRGVESLKDQELVEEICRLYGVECVSVRFDGSASEGNFQAWARERRDEVFRDMKREVQADAIATAHHRDDQVETIFQRLMRGAGMEHWGGMRVFEHGLFRPLLEVGKEEIRELAAQEGLPYRTDASNLNPVYSRNFIRLTLEPELDRFFPGWKTNLLEFGSRVQEFETMKDLLVDSVQQGATAPSSLQGGHDSEESATGDPAISRSALLSLPRTIWSLVLSGWVQRACGVSVRRGLMGVLSSIDSLHTGQQIRIGMGYSLMRDRDRLVLMQSEGDGSGFDGNLAQEEREPEVELESKGNLEKEGNLEADSGLEPDRELPVSWAITKEQILREGRDHEGQEHEGQDHEGQEHEGQEHEGHEHEVQEHEEPRGLASYHTPAEFEHASGIQLRLADWMPSTSIHPTMFRREELTMAVARLKFPLTLRLWKAGDRIQPLGMEHSRLVSDLLTDRKVPAPEKKRAWVLISFDQTVCAVIFPHVLSDGSLGVIANPVRCTTGTRSVLIARRTSFGAGSNPINPNKHL